LIRPSIHAEKTGKIRTIGIPIYYTSLNDNSRTNRKNASVQAGRARKDVMRERVKQ
jgi:hypothetical protein